MGPDRINRFDFGFVSWHQDFADDPMGVARMAP
jgi:hypothetical protein